MLAIDKMEQVPALLKKRRSLLQKLATLVEVVCAYTPEHAKGGIYSTLSGNLSNLPSSAKLARKMQEVFFTDLYVDRPERKSLYSYATGSNNLIMVVGRVGVGKTVTLKKIEQDFMDSDLAHFVYVNMRQEAPIFQEKGKSIQELLENVLLNKIANVLDDDKYGDFLMYQILTDEKLSRLRWALERYALKKIDTIEEIKELFKNDKARELTLQYPDSPSLEVLLSYVVDSGTKVVLCFDNVDKMPYDAQLTILYIALSIVEKYGIPTIIAIRDTNIRRFMIEARERQNDLSPGSSVIFFEYLDKINSVYNEGDENDGENIVTKVPFVAVHPHTIRKILERRMMLLRRHEMFGEINRHRSKYLEEWQITQDEYDRRFWEVFDDVANEFVDRGMYEFSNYNIREMLVQYASFVTTIMLNPEDDYRWENLMISRGRIDRTRLRTFLLKWQIANGGIIPKKNSSLLNIFDTDVSSRLPMLHYHILTFVHRFEERFPHRRLLLAEILDNFSLLGIDANIVKKTIGDLARARGLHELGFLWCDGRDDNIPLNAIVELNPAGRYFIKKLSTSREYVFWSALITDLPFELIPKPFRLEQTYQDDFKLTVVADFIERFLIPSCRTVNEVIIPQIEIPPTWRGSQSDYFLDNFTLDRRPYTDHLLISVRATIEHSSLSESDRERLKSRYDRLIDMFRKLSFGRNTAYRLTEMSRGEGKTPS